MRLLPSAPAIADAVAGATRLAQVALTDTARAVDVLGLLGDGAPEDPLDARDPDYIAATLSVLRLMTEPYFRADVQGLEHVPDGPVLLVGNHSGGMLIADTFVFAEAFYRRFGPDRRFHQLAHDMVFRVPGARALVARYGTIPASRENMRRALARDAALLVYPGGDHETFRPSWKSDEIDFAGRTGFVSLALELGVPVVPVVAIGGQETALFLGQGSGLARRLGLDERWRVKVVPAQIGPPFGLTWLDMPLRLPLPAKITVRVLPPIDLGRALGEDGSVERGYRLITEAMQDSLTDLSAERTLPVVG